MFQKLNENKIPKILFEQRGIVIRNVKTTKDYDYYDLKNDDLVRNPIVGFKTVGELNYLRDKGILIYDGCWRVPTEEYNDDHGKRKTKASDLFLRAKSLNFNICELSRVSSL